MTILALTLAGVSCIACALLTRRSVHLRKRCRQAEQSSRRALRRLRAVSLREATREAAAALERAGRRPGMPLTFRSGSGEDLFLFWLFEARLGGRYIEVGAYDGVTHSVTYVFEALGWTGVLIEPLPASAAQCAAARPGSRTVHAALGPAGSSGFAELTQVGSGHDAEKKSFLDSTQRQRKIIRNLGPATTVRVPLTTMDEVLKDEPAGIDFAVIDVEGGEPALLRGFDLRRHRPRVLIIEDKSDGADREVLSIVLPQGYTLAGRVSDNRVFVRDDEADLLARAVELVDHPA